MASPLFDPESASIIPEVVSYSVAAAGVTLGGIALRFGRQKYTLQERLMISEQRRLLDAKTGLLNYPAFQEEFEKRTGNTHNRAADQGRRHGLLLADIDDFKAINTRLTLPVADEKALLPVSKIFKQTVRPESDLVARFGGEEFIAFLSDTDMQGVVTVGNRLRDEVNALHPDQKSPSYRVGMTMVYTTFAQGTPLESLFEEMSAELNRAKEIPGKNQIVPLQVNIPAV